MTGFHPVHACRRRILICLTALFLCLSACSSQQEAPVAAADEHLPFFEKFWRYESTQPFFPGFVLSEGKNEDGLFYLLSHEEAGVTVSVESAQTTATVGKDGRSYSFPISVFLSCLANAQASVSLHDLTGDGQAELIYIEDTGGTGVHQSTCHVIDLQTMQEYEITPFVTAFLQSVSVEARSADRGILRCAITDRAGNQAIGETYAAEGWESRDLAEYEFLPQNGSDYYSISINENEDHACLHATVSISVENAQLGTYLGEVQGTLRFDEASQTFEPFPDSCSAFSTTTAESGAYSYDDLKAASEIIGAYIPMVYDDEAMTQSRALLAANSSFKGEIVESAIDRENNTVIFWLEDISEENIAAFRKEICSAPFLIFMQASEARPVWESLEVNS